LRRRVAGFCTAVDSFTNTTAWAAYEGVQADIFDHVLSILPEFDLRVFQNPSGQDIRGAVQASVPLGEAT